MTGEVVYIPSNLTSKFNSDPLRRDWHDFQHLATQGRYLSARVSRGYPPQQFKLAAVKKQLYHPKLPTIRRMERDDVLCRLADEHSRHTTTFTEDEFQELDPIRDDEFYDFTGLNWHDTGKKLMGSTESLSLKREPSFTFGARLREDKSATDTRPSENKLYRSPSLSVLSPSASIMKPIKYSYRNYGSGTFDQSVKHTMWPRLHMNTRNSFDTINRMPMPVQMENIFRSTSTKAAVSNAPWKPVGPMINKANKDS